MSLFSSCSSVTFSMSSNKPASLSVALSSVSPSSRLIEPGDGDHGKLQHAAETEAAG